MRIDEFPIGRTAPIRGKWVCSFLLKFFLLFSFFPEENVISSLKLASYRKKRARKMHRLHIATMNTLRTLKWDEKLLWKYFNPRHSLFRSRRQRTSKKSSSPEHLDLDEDGDGTAAGSTRGREKCVQGPREPCHHPYLPFSGRPRLPVFTPPSTGRAAPAGPKRVPAASTIFQIYDWERIRRVRRI